MGSWASLTVAGYEFAFFKSYIDPEYTVLFSHDEQVVRETEDSEDFSCTLESTASIIADRLDAIGFTLEKSQREFESWLQNELIKPENDNSFMQQLHESREPVLRDVTFDLWLKSLSHVIDNGIKKGAPSADLTPLQKLIVDDNEDCISVPCNDARLSLRAVLAAVPGNAQVKLDFTDVVGGGYYSAQDDLPAQAREQLLEDLPANQHVVIITEGSSDIAILQLGLECLRPHLVDYFRFFDFHGPRARGGASALVEMLKAFIAAGFGTRIIALFDNDTAAADALRVLSSVVIPKNIKVLSYPPIEYARHYPTIGPAGTAHLDVNGLAGSIELYLGRDILCDAGGNWTPVQWKGFNEALGRYQGELLKKSDLQTRFRSEALKWKQDPASTPDRDWSGIELIIKQITTAFAD